MHTCPAACDALTLLQVVLPEPVLVTGITVLPDAPGSDPRPVVFKAWAHDLNSPAAARFAVLIGTVQAPCQEAPVAQVRHTRRHTCSSPSTRSGGCQRATAARQKPVLCVLRAQVYPTQRVVLRSRCSKATVQLVGYALSSAPAQIKVGTMQQRGFRTKA